MSHSGRTPRKHAPAASRTPMPTSATPLKRRCAQNLHTPGTPGGGGPAPGGTRTCVRTTHKNRGRAQERRPAARRTPPRRRPAQTGRAGTGQRGRRTSAAARTQPGRPVLPPGELPLILEQGPVPDQLVQVYRHPPRVPQSAADDNGRHRQKVPGMAGGGTFRTTARALRTPPLASPTARTRKCRLRTSKRKFRREESPRLPRRCLLRRANTR
jgi:hypothetical protein